MDSVVDTTVAVTPVPETDTVAPSWKPQPVNVTKRATAPCPAVEGDNEETVGFAAIVSTLVAVDRPPSTLVSVTPRAPTGVELETERFSVAAVDEVTVTLFTVTPDVKATVIPVWKPVPVNCTTLPVAPWPTDDGESDPNSGRAVMVSASSVVCVPPSGLVSVSERLPIAVSDDTETDSVIDVDVTDDTELSVTPVPLKATVTPAWNPVPVTVTDWVPAACPIADGASAVAIGLAATVKPSANVEVPPSGFTTVIERAPMAASPAIVNDSAIVAVVADGSDVTVAEFTVMPSPENDTEAPDWKSDPVSVTCWFAAP